MTLDDLLWEAFNEGVRWQQGYDDNTNEHDDRETFERWRAGLVERR